MTPTDRQLFEMEDEHGNSAWFAVELIVQVNDNMYAALTHVDEEGNDLSEESALFRVEEEGDDLAFEPVTDDDEFEAAQAVMNGYIAQLPGAH